MIIPLNAHLFLFSAVFFSGANCMGIAFPLLIKIWLIMSILYWLYQSYEKTRFVYSYPSQVSVKISFLLLALILGGFILASVVSISHQASLNGLVRVLVYFSLCFLFFATLSLDSIELLVRRYNHLVVFSSVIGLLGLALIQLGTLPVFQHYVMKDGREYDWYILTWSLSNDSYFSFMGEELVRLQSFFDEPGTYAFILIPSLVWLFFHKKNYVLFLILVVSLLLTFSLGGIAVFILLFCLFSLHRGTVKVGLIVLGCSIPFFLYSTDGFLEALVLFVQMKMGVGDYAGEFTSGGSRVEQLMYSFQVFTQHPWGIGLNNEAIAASITSGILRDIVFSGVIGLLGYFFLYTLMLYMSIKLMISREYFYSSLGFVFLFEGLQRGSFTQTLLGLFLFAIFMKKFDTYGGYEKRSFS